LIGYWSNESFALQPGIAQISQSNLGIRDDNVAGGEQDRFTSKLNTDYMKSIAKEVGSTYIDGENIHTILDAMQKQKPARRDVAPFDLSWILASLAGLLLLAAYFNKNPIKQISEALRLYRKNAIKRQHTKNEPAIAQKNHIN
jgi:mxaL protein